MVAPTPSGYSADVTMELVIGPHHFSLAEIGDDAITLTRDVVLPGTTGEIILHIDHDERRWQVTWQPSPLPRRTVDVQFLKRPAPVK